jgi:hypothetical protein
LGAVQADIYAQLSSLLGGNCSATKSVTILEVDFPGRLQVALICSDQQCKFQCPSSR